MYNKDIIKNIFKDKKHIISIIFIIILLIGACILIKNNENNENFAIENSLPSNAVLANVPEADRKYYNNVNNVNRYETIGPAYNDSSLSSAKGWYTPTNWKNNQSIIFDLPAEKLVVGLAVMSRADIPSEYVKSFFLYYVGEYDTSGEYIDNQAQYWTGLNGNKDEIKYIIFPKPINTKKIKITPRDYNGAISMRVDLLLSKIQPPPPDENGMKFVGIDNGGRVCIAYKSVENSPVWSSTGAGLDNLSYSNGKIYGLNSASNLYYNANYRGGEYIEIPGWGSSIGLKKVSFDGYRMIVMGLNNEGDIYYADTNITSNPNWTKLTGVLKLTNLSCSNKKVYGVNSSGNVYYNSDYRTSNWTLVPGSLKQVSFDGYNMIVMGVNSTGDVFYANQTIETNPNWTSVKGGTGGLSNLSYSNGKVYGVNSYGDLYYNDNYRTSSSWRLVPSSLKLKQISFEFGTQIIPADPPPPPPTTTIPPPPPPTTTRPPPPPPPPPAPTTRPFVETYLPPNSMLANVPEGINTRIYSTIYDNNLNSTAYASSTLSSEQAWSARINDDKQFLKLVLPNVTSVIGVAVRGRGGTSYDYQYVKTFYVDYIDRHGSLKKVDNSSLFNTGLTGRGTQISYITFSKPINAKSIIIKPVEFNNAISMRADLIISIQEPQTTRAPAPTVIPLPNNYLSDALDDSYNDMNVSRFNILDNQDRLNTLNARINKIRKDLATNTVNNTNSASVLTFY